MPLRIDSHHHFWRYEPSEYAWIGDGMSQLRRDFMPAHLVSEIRQAAVDGVVSVQVSQSLEETARLLGYAGQYSFIRGVVGWAPLANPDVGGILERLAGDSALKGIRHIVQDEPDDRFLLRADFNRGIAQLRTLELAYDILIYERHLPVVIEFVDQHPDQLFVLDHMAKPRISDGLLSPWRENLMKLAHRENVHCKLSGMATEADWSSWSAATLEPYFEIALEAFGPRRLMFGSDWPVALLACDYQQWISVVDGFLAKLSDDEQARIWGLNAVDAYRL